MNQVVKGWQLHRWTGGTLNELAAWVNQIVPRWVRYYGRYYPSLLRPLLRRINAYILRWARNKVPAAKVIQESPRVVERSRATRPHPLHALAVDDQPLDDWMRRAP
jgi:hypothetical protein